MKTAKDLLKFYEYARPQFTLAGNPDLPPEVAYYIEQLDVYMGGLRHELKRSASDDQEEAQ